MVQPVRWFVSGFGCDLDLECFVKSHVLVRFKVLCSMAAHGNFWQNLEFYDKWHIVREAK